MSSVTEVHKDELSLLSQNGQLLSPTPEHNVKQVMPVSSPVDVMSCKQCLLMTV